jgi:hypothetical protein
MLGFALAMLVALVAVFLFFQQSQLMWLVAAVPVALWVGFKGGPLLLRALEDAGLFGRVRIEDGRLRVGRSSDAIRLADPFEVDARLQTATIRREVDLKDAGVTSTHAHRTSILRVKVFTVLVTQDGMRHQLVADETDRASGPDYETSGMAVRPLPVTSARATKTRLWGADLAQLLGQLREAPGYSTPAVGEQPEPLEDPRRAFCPTWKVAVGTVAILCVFAAGSLAAYQGYAERAHAEWVQRKADAERLRQEVEAAVRPLVGRRVVIDAAEGARIVGTVESYRLIESMTFTPGFEAWHADVSFVVEELIDAQGNVLPGDEAVRHRFTTEPVRRGDRLDHRADGVELWPVDPGPDQPSEGRQ